jgi:hypothetical protein
VISRDLTWYYFCFVLFCFACFFSSSSSSSSSSGHSFFPSHPLLDYFPQAGFTVSILWQADDIQRVLSRFFVIFFGAKKNTSL